MSTSLSDAELPTPDLQPPAEAPAAPSARPRVGLTVVSGAEPPREAPAAGRPAVDPATLTHSQLKRGRFWSHIPAYAEVDEATFLDHKWQSKHTITNVDKLLAAVRGLVSSEFLRDAAEGFQRAPMSVRVSPYLLSLINWEDPYSDPLRIQFIPLSSRLLPDHPKLGLDSLHEMADAPVAGLRLQGGTVVFKNLRFTWRICCRFSLHRIGRTHRSSRTANGSATKPGSSMATNPSSFCIPHPISITSS